MHWGGWGSLAWNSECTGGCWDWNFKCMRGFLVLEFRRGGAPKNSDLLTSEVWKTSLVCARAKQTEPQRYDYEVGMSSLFRIAMKRLFDSCSSGLLGD